MNFESLKHLLASRRPGDESRDEHVMAALRKLQDDPDALAAAEAELHLDESIRAALHREIPVPADLVHKLHAIAPSGKIVGFPRRAVLGWLGGAAAACVTGAYFFMRRPLAFEDWKSTAMAWVRDPKLEKQDSQLAVLKTHLASRGALVPEGFPATLVSMPTIGCQCLTVDGQSISVVCFLRNEHAFHTFITRADRVSSAGEFLGTHGPKIWSGAEGWNFATWQAADQGYMLLTQAPEKELRELFA